MRGWQRRTWNNIFHAVGKAFVKGAYYPSIIERWSKGVLTANVENFVETSFICFVHNSDYDTELNSAH